ncbi:MAG: membrane protein insertion efficiency factor YidD [bacterium]
MRWLVELIKLPVRIYRWVVSPLLGPRCRFHPSCSVYTLQALDRHGPLRGLRLGILRVVRCGPWSAGGYDPVPDEEDTE